MTPSTTSATINVLWFSRHAMTHDQYNALAEKLGDISVVQFNGTAENVHVQFECLDVDKQHPEVVTITGLVSPFKELVNQFDVIAIVAPIGLQQQILSIAGNKPVIMALNGRIFGPDGKANFVFQKWERLVKIDIIKEDF